MQQKWQFQQKKKGQQGQSGRQQYWKHKFIQGEMENSSELALFCKRPRK